MNLIVDVGNSFVKLAVFDGNNMVSKEEVALNDFVDSVKNVQKQNKSIKYAIISTVGKLDQDSLNQIKNSMQVMVLNPTTKLPFSNKYKTPDTLGVDRIALVSASVQQYPNKNVLIIDAGTCITYDFINSKSNYLGGAISPGIRMRYTALNNLTAKLPLLDTEVPNSIIGNTTSSSIHSGVVNGVINEIEGFIEDYARKYSDLTVILTGGDAKFLSKQLKSSIFANSNFLLEGLNFILLFNSN